MGSADQPLEPEDLLAQDIEAARAGCAEALDRLFEACREYLWRVGAEAIDADLPPRVDASNLMRDSLLEARRDFAAFHGRTLEDLRGWLRQILLRNLAAAQREFGEAPARQLPCEERPGGDQARGEQPAADTP